MRTQTLVQTSLFVFAASLPLTASADPGELTGIEIDTQGNNFGYWEYLPTAYDEAEEWPVFIFLSGIGENGNGMLDPTECANGPATAGDYLCRNLRHGPQLLIWNQLHDGQDGLWNDEERPFVVISPQNPAPLYQMTAYDVDDLDVFLQYLIDNYAIDERRMYVAGMSIGGYSVVLSLQAYPHRYSAVSIMPGIVGAEAQMDACNFTEQNMWVFHGEDDGNPFNPNGPVSLVRLFNECPQPHPTARATMYANAGHNVWTRTIDPQQGMDDPVLDEWTAQGQTVQLVPYDPDIYTWMLLHDKPVVDAGADVDATTDDASIQVIATTEDDDPITYTWTQTAGDALTINGADTDTLELTDFDVGSYTFEVLAVDSDGQWDRDEVTVNVAEGQGGGSTGTTGGTTGTTGSTGSTGDTGTTGATTSGTGTDSAATDSGDTDSAGTDGTTNGTESAGTESGTITQTGTGGGSIGTDSGGSNTTPTTETASDTATATATEGGGTDTEDTAGENVDDEGCGCTTARNQSPTLGLGLLALLGLIRRRRT